MRELLYIVGDIAAVVIRMSVLMSYDMNSYSMYNGFGPGV